MRADRGDDPPCGCRRSSLVQKAAMSPRWPVASAIASLQLRHIGGSVPTTTRQPVIRRPFSVLAALFTPTSVTSRPMIFVGMFETALEEDDDHGRELPEDREAAREVPEPGPAPCHGRRVRRQHGMEHGSPLPAQVVTAAHGDMESALDGSFSPTRLTASGRRRRHGQRHPRIRRLSRALVREIAKRRGGLLNRHLPNMTKGGFSRPFLSAARHGARRGSNPRPRAEVVLYQLSYTRISFRLDTAPAKARRKAPSDSVVLLTPKLLPCTFINAI